MNISCIIPTRNRSRMVLKAIQSATAQKTSVHEIIVVDDGSTDDTLAAVASHYPEVHLVRLNGMGPGAARNAGAAVANGDILMFLDSDDIWFDNHVQQLVYTLNRGFQVAYGVARTRDEVNSGDFLIPENGEGFDGDCFPALIRWCFLVPSSMAIHREIFLAAGGFPKIACGEDWIFFLKLAAQYQFGFAGPEPITMRHLHRDSLCFLSDKKKLLVMINHMLRFLKNEPRATVSHLSHFRRLHDWTAANKTHWSTVQDWYVSLLQENII